MKAGRVTRLALALASALLVVGCGVAGLDRPSPMAARIVMTESGGIAGIVNVLTIEPNLAVSYQTRQGVKSGRLTSQQMADVVAAFYDNNFFGMRDDYRPDTVIADGITTSIVYSDSKRSKSVITGTNAKEPAGLQSVMRALLATVPQMK